MVRYLLQNLLQTKEKFFNLVTFLLFLAVFFSMGSQVKELQMFRQAMNFAWSLVLLVLVYHSRPKMEITRFGMDYLFLYVLFFGFCLLTTLFFQNHMNTNLFKPLGICLFTYLAGALLGKLRYPLDRLNQFILFFCILTVCLSVYIRVFYLSNFSQWIRQTSYLYTSKNSAGQLIGVTVILLLFYRKTESRFTAVLKIASIVFLSYVLVLIQCRTAILAVAVVAFIYLFRAQRGRAQYFFAVLCLVVFVISNQTAWSILEKALLLDGVDRGIDTFSSGRLAFYQDAWNQFSVHIFTGTGSTYVDNFYLAVLTENGIIGAFLILPVWFKRIWCNFFQKLPEGVESLPLKRLESSVMLLTVFYLVESFFEGLPPFGPGVCAFMLWTLSGYLDAFRDKVEQTAAADGADKGGLIRKRPIQLRHAVLRSANRTETARPRFYKKQIPPPKKSIYLK